VTGALVAAPPGYTRFEARDATVIARNDALEGLRAALRDVRTLHCWASTLPGAKPFQGRATAWGARLPGTALDVVVRHARHGGFFAALTGDRFLWPGRAPWELDVAERLREAGVPTPALIAYALYPAGPMFCRCDVATKRLPDGADFPELWAESDAVERSAILDATATLLRALAAVRAHHPDLNAKNIYVARDGNTFRAFVLDVDRIGFQRAGDTSAGPRNLARLTRSLRKFRTKHRLPVREDEIGALERMATS
jgi:3-deoxy-D-manno-octulosonic acid kinase